MRQAVCATLYRRFLTPNVALAKQYAQPVAFRKDRQAPLSSLHKNRAALQGSWSNGPENPKDLVFFRCTRIPWKLQPTQEKSIKNEF